MKMIVCVILLIIFISGCSEIKQGKYVKIKDNRIVLDEKKIYRDTELARKIEVRDSVYSKKGERGYKLNFFFSNRGYGYLVLSRRRVLIMDYIADPADFKKGVLNLNLIDINQDGHLDLLISGVERTWAEQDDEIASKRQILIYILYNPETNVFYVDEELSKESMDFVFYGKPGSPRLRVKDD